MNLDFLDNKYFFAVFSILMLMYASQIRQPLPKFMMDLFQNPIFRVAILFLVLVRGYKDPQFSLIVAVAFILIMNIVNEQLFKESFEDTLPNIISDSNIETLVNTTPNNNIFKDTIQNITTSIVDVSNIVNKQLFNESFEDTNQDTGTDTNQYTNQYTNHDTNPDTNPDTNSDTNPNIETLVNTTQNSNIFKDTIQNITSSIADASAIVNKQLFNESFEDTNQYTNEYTNQDTNHDTNHDTNQDTDPDTNPNIETLVNTTQNSNIFKDTIQNITSSIFDASAIVNKQLFNESFEDTVSNIATGPNIYIDTDVTTDQNITSECFKIKQKINDLDECIKHSNLLDCSNEIGVNKETCEKNNDDIIGLKATLGRKKYKTSEILNNKCTGIDFGSSNTPSNNLVCKDI